MKKKTNKGLIGLLVISALFLAGGTLVSCSGNGGGDAPISGGHSYSGAGEPPATLGEDGDTYTDTETGATYTKINGTWVKNEDGSTMYSGEGAPSDTLGKDGDKYTDTLTGAIYEKQNGTWVLIKKGDTTYVVTFNLNGGQFADGSTTYPDQIVREGRWITAPTSDPTKEHCEFLGWYAEGSSTAWDFVGNAVYGNVDLVAQWRVKDEDKITITVDPNNGDDSYTVETYVGDYCYPTIPTKDGYSFIGWYIKSTDEKYSGYVTEDMAGETIYAKYEKSKFNVVYQVESNGEITITGIIDIETVTLNVPNEINGRKVTKISSKAFNDRVYLESIFLPANVKTIEDGAFRGTMRLSQILVDSGNTNYVSQDGVLFTKDMKTLVCHPTKADSQSAYSCPSTLTRIGSYAFYDSKDNGISSITFNEGLVTIGQYAFYNNETITSLNFPSTLKTIEKAAFYGPSYASDEDDYSSPEGVIQTVSFNDGLEEIGEMAFVNQYFQETLTLPSTVKTLGDYAFANCNAIEEFVFPRDLENYGRNVFAGATGILGISIEEGNTHFKVEDGILYTYDMTKAVMCPSGRTEAVNIPEGVTELADFAFYMCDELQEYSFPSTLTKIGEQCFSQTYDLKSFVIPDSVTEIGENCFDLSGITSVTIGTGLTEIPEEAFIETNLTSVTIPGNVKKIGNGAFSLCSKLTSLTLNEGLEEISQSAFNSTAVASLAMPSTLKSIGSRAFAGSSITEFNIGKSLENIGVQVFEGDNGTNITSITVDSENTKFVAESDMLLSKDKTTVYFADSSACVNGSVTIPENVTVIADYAFSYFRSITELHFGSKLASIGDGSFMYTTKLKSVSFPASLKTIGEGAFYFSGVGTAEFAEGLETIEGYAFRMADLTSVTLPDSVKTIGEYAFTQTLMLKTLDLGNGVEEIGDFAFSNTKLTGTVTIPASVTKIGTGAFASTVSTYGQSLTSFAVASGNASYSASSDGAFLMDKAQTTILALAGSVKSFTFPSTVTAIGDYGMAANQCKATSLVLPDSVTSIGTYGLAYLMKITSFTVPSTVTDIGFRAFDSWLTSQSIVFSCTRDYALMNFQYGYLVGCSASVTYAGE